MIALYYIDIHYLIELYPWKKAIRKSVARATSTIIIQLYRYRCTALKPVGENIYA